MTNLTDIFKSHHRYDAHITTLFVGRAVAEPPIWFPLNRIPPDRRRHDYPCASAYSAGLQARTQPRLATRLQRVPYTPLATSRSQKEIIADFPMKRVKLPIADRKKPDAFTSEEVRRLLRAANRCASGPSSSVDRPRRPRRRSRGLECRRRQRDVRVGAVVQTNNRAAENLSILVPRQDGLCSNTCHS